MIQHRERCHKRDEPGEHQGEVRCRCICNCPEVQEPLNYQPCRHEIRAEIPGTKIPVDLYCKKMQGHTGRHLAVGTYNGFEFEVEYDVVKVKADAQDWQDTKGSSATS